MYIKWLIQATYICCGIPLPSKWRIKLFVAPTYLPSYLATSLVLIYLSLVLYEAVHTFSTDSFVVFRCILWGAYVAKIDIFVWEVRRGDGAESKEREIVRCTEGPNGWLGQLQPKSEKNLHCKNMFIFYQPYLITSMMQRDQYNQCMQLHEHNNIKPILSRFRINWKRQAVFE